MSQRDPSLKPLTDLEFHASGFIVKVQGSWTDTALQEFRQFCACEVCCQAIESWR